MATIDDFLTAVQLSRAKEGEDLTWRAILDDLSDEDLRKIRGAFSTGNTRSHLIHDAVRQTWGATLSRDEGPFRSLKESLMPSGKRSTAKQIRDTFAGLGGGVKINASKKQLEYALRILRGESPDKVLEGIGPVTRSLVSNLVDELRSKASSTGHGAYSVVRAGRAASRTRRLPAGRGMDDFLDQDLDDIEEAMGLKQPPPRALARRGGLARRPRAPFDPGPEVIDAEFTERPRRRRGRSPGPPRGEPLVTDAPTPRKMLPQKVDLSKSPVSKLAKLKGLTRFLGPVAVGLAAVDLAARVLDASQGNIDRQRLHREAIGEDLLANVGLGLEEQQAENTRRAVGGLANVQQGLDLAAAVRAPVEEYNDLEGLLLQRRAELAGVAVRAEPSRDEYMLAMRRFM